MDNAWLEIFDRLMIKRSKKYLESFPQGEHEDRISELVWWVKSKTCNPSNIYNFVITNVRNTYKLLTKWILHNIIRDDYFNWIQKNPWLMCEYFLVDYFSRYWKEFENYKNQRFKFIHKKWAPEQDEDLKIDFLSTLITKNEVGKYISVNFWVQLTTAKSRAEYSKKSLNWLDWIGNKKWDITRTSNKIDVWEIVNFPPSYIPDTMCLFVINSHINELINIENINIFSNAFIEWKNNWFTPGWPTQYLSDEVKNDLVKINDWYHLWLEIFYKLIPKVVSNERDFKNLKKYNNFDIIIDYDSGKRELKMDYFIKDWTFLMSLFFIINQNLVSKVIENKDI